MDKQDLNKYLDKINKNNKENKENTRNNKHNYLFGLVVRTLISFCLFLICLILCKSSNTYKDNIYKHVFYENITFSKVNNFFNKYLGGIIPFDNIFKNTTQTVFNESLTYSEESIYLDGVKLKVDTNYLIPTLESGIVVYVGEKEGYGNTVIIQGMDGVDIWYGNINTSNVKLYDYVEKSSYLGDAKEDILYLAFYKEGKFLDYHEYIK